MRVNAISRPDPAAFSGLNRRYVRNGVLLHKRNFLVPFPCRIPFAFILFLVMFLSLLSSVSSPVPFPFSFPILFFTTYVLFLFPLPCPFLFFAYSVELWQARPFLLLSLGALFAFYLPRNPCVYLQFYNCSKLKLWTWHSCRSFFYSGFRADGTIPKRWFNMDLHLIDCKENVGICAIYFETTHCNCVLNNTVYLVTRS